MRPSDGNQLVRQSRFVTFDGGVCLSTAHQRPDRYRHLEVDFGDTKRIARGAGLSYAAASFGDGVLVQEMSAFDRLLAFDENNNTVRVEAGASLERLLTWAMQRALYLPVVPGYPLITVGGCIAADVHGKNPLRDGTFCDWVEGMTLYHPARGFIKITRHDESELFAATCGGYGLTGLIVDATLRLTTQPAQHVLLRRVAVQSLSEALEKLEQDRQSDFAYSWHDGAARGRTFGRGVLFFGCWRDESIQLKNKDYSKLSAAKRGSLWMSLWTRGSVAAANAVFLRLAIRQPTQVKSAFDALFPFARQTLYHRFYGKRGFAETQVLVPDGRQEAFVRRLTTLVHEIDPPLVMMSMKRFSGRQQSLSMSGTGMLLALDLARSTATTQFLKAFDALVVTLGVQPNVSKDSRLPAAIAAGTLPHFARFRARLRAFDRDRLYESEVSRRLDI